MILYTIDTKQDNTILNFDKWKYEKQND